MSNFYGEIAFRTTAFNPQMVRNNKEEDTIERSLSFQDTHVYAALSYDKPKPEVCDGIYLNDNNDIILICTGYIYNYCDIKKKAKKLRSSSESQLGEDLLSLYLNYGMEWLKDINGQFSFVIYDLRKREAFLAVDRTGIYNLYYAFADGNLYFASDMKTILKYSKVEKKLNFKALQQMILFCSIASPDTIVKSIKSISGGTYVKLGETSGMKFTYWDLLLPERGKSPERLLTNQEYIECFEDILGKSVKNRMNSSGSNGVLLSGGLDSSIVAAYLHKLSPEAEIYTFSLDYKFADLSESLYQNIMVNELNSKHVVKDFSLSDFSRILPEAVKGAEGPFCELGTCAYYYLYQLTNTRKCDLFSGLGADELFAGYITYKADRFKKTQVISETDQKINYILWGNDTFSYESPSYADEMRWLKELFTESAANAILREDCLYESIFNREAIDRDLEILHRRSYIDFKLRLINHKNFQIASKISRKHGKQTHYPFLDNRMLDFVCELPAKFKLKGNTDKYIIREAARKCVPSSIIDRKKISLGDFSYAEVISFLLNNYNKYFTYDYIISNNLISYEFIHKLINRLYDPKSALDRFREKNIILTYLTLCIFIDSFNIQIY